MDAFLEELRCVAFLSKPRRGETKRRWRWRERLARMALSLWRLNKRSLGLEADVIRALSHSGVNYSNRDEQIKRQRETLPGV